MSNVLKPDESSQTNIERFLQTVPRDDVRILLEKGLETVLEVGRLGSGKQGQASRDRFFAAVDDLIESRLREEP